MMGPLIYPPHPITFAQYMAEQPIKRRYDIIHGVRVFAVPPSPHHQLILGNILYPFMDFDGPNDFITLFSLFDVLISWEPFCTRQPDVLLVSKTRWQQHEAAGAQDGWPLTVAPELVVQILSSVDRELALEGKIRDYCAIGANECWVVRPESQTIGVLRLTPDGPETVGTYSDGETVDSLTLPDLRMAVADVFTI